MAEACRYPSVWPKYVIIFSRGTTLDGASPNWAMSPPSAMFYLVHRGSPARQNSRTSSPLPSLNNPFSSKRRRHLWRGSCDVSSWMEIIRNFLPADNLINPGLMEIRDTQRSFFPSLFFFFNYTRGCFSMALEIYFRGKRLSRGLVTRKIIGGGKET